MSSAAVCTVGSRFQSAIRLIVAWIAVLAMGVNIPLHRSFVPFILADVGALLVSWVMFVSYSRGLEILGFAMLVVAALRDRYLRRRGPAPVSNAAS